MNRMPEPVIDFVCMADSKYGKWLSLCIRAIQRFHPNSRIYVFDLSPESNTIAACCSVFDNIVHVPFPSSEWRYPSWIDKANFSFFWPRFTIRETIKYWTRRLRHHATRRTKEGWMIDKELHVQKMRLFCRIVSLKPHILIRALELSQRNIAFIDVDAIVLKSLTQVFDSFFDIAITCEDPKDIVISANPPECADRPAYPIRAVNTGVIFLRNGTATTEFLSDWISEMDSVYDTSTEQTALANLVFKISPKFFIEYPPLTSTLVISNRHTVLVKKLPMNTYNKINFDIAAKESQNGVYILHFVGSKKQEKNWGIVSNYIEQSILLNKYTSIE